MTNELTNSESVVKYVLSASEIKAQVNLIQEVMKAVMKPNVHYGIISGCGDKPVLLKPGSEKILSTFKIAVNPIVDDLSTPDCSKYRVTARGLSMNTHSFLGAGIGECSSDEEKYKWKKAVCDEEHDETPEDRRRVKWKQGWKDKPNYKVKQIRTNPADIANTVLKMAKKRAQIDMCLTVTAASDIFTQDLDETEVDTQQNRSSVKKPQPASSQSIKPAKPAANNIVTIPEALKASTGANITINGTVTNATTRKTANEKSITDYAVCEDAQNIAAGTWIMIQMWGEILEGLQLGDKIKSDIIVQEFRGKKQYQAQTIVKIDA